MNKKKQFVSTKRRKKGFTIVEFSISVMAMIGVGAVGVPAYEAIINQSKDVATVMTNNAKTLDDVVAASMADPALGGPTVEEILNR